MNWWGWFLLIVGVVTYFLPQIGMMTLGHPIVFMPFELLGDNSVYANIACAVIGFLMIFVNYFKRS